VSAESFVAGYGAAQAVPGPLFTFSAYLRAARVAPAEFAVAPVDFGLLVGWKLPPRLVVLLSAVGGMLLGVL
jgi:chromate transporter